MTDADPTRDALAAYAWVCTSTSQSTWDNLPREGLYPVMAVNANESDFLDCLFLMRRYTS